MAVVIRLMRHGSKKRPFFRMVAADSRRQRDGRFLEILGHYDPLKQPYELVVQKENVEAWIAKGARPSEQVASLLRTIGVKMHNASKPAKVAAAAAPAAAAAAKPKATKKAAVKKAAPKKASERKVMAKALRASGKKKVAKKKPKKA
jgi:small subunit ribosomal protein S16